MVDQRKSAFRARVAYWVQRLDVGAHSVTLRPMRNKWASCSTSGRMTFNSDLLPLDEALWDYVIVHELLHFFAPNHGKLWKSLMAAYLGDYRALETRLREGEGTATS
ncbi:M48 metallopeptidase family protein [Propionivibrio sp.]|uniref:M48 metallopeptidase family protein n=1 Tax=Propionivibrio sp. TaxID=2212460 RepID=UPI00272E22DF|nr:M48 family metallopeptidase [Propionivibrio sp.]